MELTKCKFKDVRLGAVFFDPESGQKYQKIGTEYSQGKENARHAKGLQSFKLDHEVKAHESKIIN